MWFLDTTFTIPSYQYEIRKNRSTTDCLAQFEIHMKAAMSRKEHTKAVFFDLTTAYDIPWKHGLLKKMHT